MRTPFTFLTFLAALLLASFPLQAEHTDQHAHGTQHGLGLDTREPLLLSREEAAHLRLEMRGFLAGLQQIVSAAASQDMAALGVAARASGMAAAHEVPAGLRAKLPLAFRKLGNATHTGFDDLARDAASLGDSSHALEQLGGLMQNCVACHARYRIESADPHQH